MTTPTPPVSTIPGNPQHSLFNRISRATNNPQFDAIVNEIAELSGFTLQGFEEIISSPTPVQGNFQGTIIQKLTSIRDEAIQSILNSNIVGNSGIPQEGRTPPDTRTINQTTGRVSLGRATTEGERFNDVNGALYRRVQNSG